MMDAIDLAMHLRTEYGDEAINVLNILESEAKKNTLSDGRTQKISPEYAAKINEKYGKTREILEKGCV